MPTNDIRRPPLWYRDAVIYEVHVRAFADSNGDGIGDFPGLTSRLDYLQQLGVTAIWLLPFYPSPLRDDGYDIADYFDVHPSYGTIDDFKEFLAQAHARDIHVITELVINHTSDQHPWFQRARRAAPDSPERDFYVWSDTDEQYPEVRVIFSDTETSNWAWDGEAEAYYWHRFFSHQPDLNWDNQLVREGVIEVLDYWLDMGVDGLRLDAVPYLHEREGTSGENLPETHDELRLLRAHIDAKYGDRMLLAEANQWPEDSVAYFGNDDECHMAFHFPLMPRLYLALERESRLPIIDILEQTPDIPDGAQWAIFLRNHDELTLEMVTEEERDLMWRSYAPDRRARLNLGIRRRLAPLLENDRRRIELLHSLLLSLPGTPTLYYGDEIGMGDNVFLADRDGVRTPMQWSNDRNAGFSKANPQSLYLPVVVDPQFHYETVNVEAQHDNPNSLLWWVRRMIRRRRRLPALGRGSITFLDPQNTQVLTFLRRTEDETILVVANLSQHVQFVELDLSEFSGQALTEVLGQTELPTIGELPYLLTLSPYAFYWLNIQHADSESGAAADAIDIEGPLEDIFDSDQPLAETLARYASRQSWYQDRDRRQLRAEVFDAIPLPADDASLASWVVLLDVDFVTGHPTRYVMPIALDFTAAMDLPDEAQIATVSRNGNVGRLFDAVFDSRITDLLRNAVSEDTEMLGRTGTLWGRPSVTEQDLEDDDATRVVEQTADGETFVQYRPDLTLKLFRNIEPGVNPDLDLRRFLTERSSFEKLSPVYGSIEYQSGDAFTVGIMQRAFDPRQNAWILFQDLCRDFFTQAAATAPGQQPVKSGWTERTLADLELAAPALVAACAHARRLGATTADLHQALGSHAEDPDIRPDPFTALYQRSLYQSLRATVRQDLSTIRRLEHRVPDEVHDELDEILGAELQALDIIDRIRRLPLGGQRIRIHGNYRLDELRLVNGDFYVLDLSGDHTRPMSQRRLKASPLRDVAQMLRSFDYVGQSIASTEPGETGRATLWHRLLGEEFVQAYMDQCEGFAALPTSMEGVDTLLTAFEVAQSVRQLRWEMVNRPEWAPVALRGALYYLRPVDLV